MAEDRQEVSLVQARIVAFAILMSMIAMTGLGIAIATGAVPIGDAEADEAVGKTLGTVFLVVGIATIGLSHLVRSALNGRAAKSSDPSRARFMATIVAMALGETPATLALVNGILTHNVTTTALLGAAAIITGLLHFPRASMFE